VTANKSAATDKVPTKVDRLIDAINKLNRAKVPARTPILSQETGIPQSSIGGLLQGPENRGDVTSCLVTDMASGRHMREYRIGPGVAMDFKPLKTGGRSTPQLALRATGNGVPPLPKPVKTEKKNPIVHPFLAGTMPDVKEVPPKPEVGQNTGSAGSATPMGIPPSEARAVANQPARTEIRSAGRGDDFKIVIDQDGAVSCYDSTGFTVDFTPTQTLALGDFLHLTENLWRP